MAKTPDNRPWAPHPIPDWIIREFRRRQNDIGYNYPVSVTWDENGTWQHYKGPMTAWARVFSNGNGKVNEKSTFPERNGFVLQGGQGFDRVYGIPNNRNVLGYDSEGQEHILDLSNDGNLVSFPNSLSDDTRTVQKFLPNPGIVSIDAVIQKERIRKITVNWKCYGYAQLEYMTPYFLTPKISAFVEFGWNHFNPESLLDLRFQNLDNLKELFTTNGYLLYDENIKKSYGLYDVTMGIISGFEFSSQDGISYDCKTEILSKHANYSGVLVNNSTKVESDNSKTNVQSSFASYLEKRLTKLPNCIINKKNFLEPLDAQEVELKEKGEFKTNFDFYLNKDGKRKTEDRFFIGRRKEYGDESIMRGMAKYDWDKSDQKDVWVTFGFLIELSNLFFSQLTQIKPKNGEPFPLYKISTDDVVIGAHPNLISCDGNVLLIPNAKAPKFNIGNTYPTSDPEDNDYQKQTINSNPSIKQSFFKTISGKYDDEEPPDRTLAKVFLTGISKRAKSTNAIGFGSVTLYEGESTLLGLADKVETDQQVGSGACIMRDDLDTILNRFRYEKTIGNEQVGTKSFPRWDVDEPISNKPKGYWGNINDLFINKNVIIECAKSADTVEVFYNDLLNKINNAAGKMWELAVVEDNDVLKVIDKKFIKYDDKSKIYQFDVGATHKFIKNISFTAQLSNVAANQVISSASNNKGKSPNGTINSNQSLNFPYGDRFNSNQSALKEKTKNSGLIDNNLETIRQLQNSPENAGGNKGGSYIMSFKSYAPGSVTKTYVGGVSGGLSGGLLPASMSTPLIEVEKVDLGKETGWNIVNLVLPNEALLLALLNDMDVKNNSNIYGGQQPGFTVEMTLQGISGLRTFQLFSLKNLPSPYSEREIMCQIVDVSHKVDGGNWTTTIKAGIRSIRGQSIKFTTDGINEYTINATQ